MAFLGIELGKLLAARPELVDDPALADYRHYLERNLRVAPYLLSEAEERIIMAKDQTGITAWSKLQSKWLSTRQFRPVVRGEEKVLSMGEMVPLIYDPDRATRKAAYGAMGATLGVDQLLWADALRTIWTDHIQMCKIRKYPSPLTSSLIANDVEEESIAALMRVVDSNAPLVQRYFRLKAGLLGLEILGNWDLQGAAARCSGRDVDLGAGPGGHDLHLRRLRSPLRGVGPGHVRAPASGRRGAQGQADRRVLRYLGRRALGVHPLLVQRPAQRPVHPRPRARPRRACLSVHPRPRTPATARSPCAWRSAAACSASCSSPSGC